jgi:hypothetical protein
MNRSEGADERVHQMMTINTDTTPEEGRPAQLEKSTGVKTVRYIACSALLAAFALLIYDYSAGKREEVRPTQPKPDISIKPQPAMQVPAAEVPAPQGIRLPGVIPLDSADTSYSSTHPGWQRYENSSLEFRVLRGDGIIKAIQVLSKQEDVITAGFFTSFLAEAAGAQPFTVQSEEVKDGYSIAKGTAGSATKVIVYRKKGELKAFVVSCE